MIHSFSLFLSAIVEMNQKQNKTRQANSESKIQTNQD